MCQASRQNEEGARDEGSTVSYGTHNFGISVMKLKVDASALRGMSCQGEMVLPSFCSSDGVGGVNGRSRFNFHFHGEGRGRIDPPGMLPE